MNDLEFKQQVLDAKSAVFVEPNGTMLLYGLVVA